MTDTLELELAIKRAGLTKRQVAKELNLSEMGLYQKIHNITEFKVSEIKILQQILNLSRCNREAIFFANNSD